MNIQVAVLCDAANEDNGKLNLLGAFDTIYAPQMPAVHPQCSVALRVTFMSGDEGARKLEAEFRQRRRPPHHAGHRNPGVGRAAGGDAFSSRAISSSTSSS